MKPEVLLELLENAADQLGVRVSYESLQTSVVHGGLCRVKGQFRIIVDKRATSEERVVTLASALALLPSAELAAIGRSPSLAPQVCELLACYRRPAPKGKAAPSDTRPQAAGRAL